MNKTSERRRRSDATTAVSFVPVPRCILPRSYAHQADFSLSRGRNRRRAGAFRVDARAHDADADDRRSGALTGRRSRGVGADRSGHGARTQRDGHTDLRRERGWLAATATHAWGEERHESLVLAGWQVRLFRVGPDG